MQNKNLKIPLNKEENNKVKLILDQIQADPQSADFLEPVDYIGMGLLDYPKIVSHPMDLGTIRKNLKAGKYSTVQDVLNDIQLVWDNCKLYNMEGSDIYKMAQHLEKIFKKSVEKHFLKQKGQIQTSKKFFN